MPSRRTLLTSALLCALVAGCGQEPPTAATPAPAEALDVAAETVEFDPDGWATRPVVAMSEDPILLDRFAGWWGKAERPDEPGAARRAGRTYLAVADSTRCRRPTGVQVRRVLDDLRVTFTGGDELPECVRAYGPAVVITVATADLAGVRTVNGRAPVSAEGPGTATGFFRITGPPAGATAAESGAGTAALAAALAAAQATEGPEVAQALATAPPPGRRGFAFVVSGCSETGAVLLVSRAELAAQARGGNGVTCYLPEYYLATFTIADDEVPPGARPVTG